MLWHRMSLEVRHCVTKRQMVRTLMCVCGCLQVLSRDTRLQTCMYCVSGYKRLFSLRAGTKSWLECEKVYPDLSWGGREESTKTKIGEAVLLLSPFSKGFDRPPKYVYIWDKPFLAPRMLLNLKDWINRGLTCSTMRLQSADAWCHGNIRNVCVSWIMS